MSTIYNSSCIVYQAAATVNKEWVAKREEDRQEMAPFGDRQSLADIMYGTLSESTMALKSVENKIAEKGTDWAKCGANLQDYTDYRRIDFR